MRVWRGMEEFPVLDWVLAWCLEPSSPFEVSGWVRLISCEARVVS